MFDLRAVYEELILDHNRNPRNYPKRPEGANCSAHGLNPQCGDEFRVHMRVQDGVIQDIGFEGGGCAISTASASLMTEAVKGRTTAQAEALFTQVHDILTREGEGMEGRLDLLGKLAVLVGVKDYPLRVKCATLSWHIMHAALHGHHATITTE